jgi:hypothetical protein
MHPGPAVHPFLAVHDRVRTPDGRVGEVIGFYLRESESVLVGFPSGGYQEFPIQGISALFEPGLTRAVR